MNYRNIPSATAFKLAVVSVTLSITLSFMGPALAGAGHGPATDERTPDRTIHIIATDNDFSPEKIVVVAGETVRFKVTNKGEALHDFTVGSPAAQKEHRDMMAQMAAMEGHDMTSHGHGDHGSGESAAVIVKPGETQYVVWTFESGQEVTFSCNFPGHHEAGMNGDFHVVEAHNH